MLFRAGLWDNQRSMAKEHLRKKGKRFVVHKHSRGKQLHWDLMLQAGQVLETYRLQLPPEQLRRYGCIARRIFDHPLKFLSYEGSVNNGQGTVEIVDSGTYEILSQDEEKIELQFNGSILTSKFELMLK